MDLYKLKIKERIGDMRDPEANCNDYDDKTGFKDCVMEAVKEKFLTRYGCSPPWFTENIEDVCHGNMSQEKWKQVSDEIFPTMDHSFLKVYKCFLINNLFSFLFRNVEDLAKQWR